MNNQVFKTYIKTTTSAALEPSLRSVTTWPNPDACNYVGSCNRHC